MNKLIKMHFLAVLYYLLHFASAQIHSVPYPNQVKVQKILCNGLIFHHVYYDKQFVSCNRGKPSNLLYHKFSNKVYFSRTIKSNSGLDFNIMACHIKNKECEDIRGIPGGYALAYDRGNDDIFMGGHDGIYKYNFIKKEAEFFSENGKSIWSIFIRWNFYYIEYPAQKLYIYKHDTFVPVAEAMGIQIDQFYVAQTGNIYFSNETALYKVEKPSRDVVVLDDDLVIRQIAEDHFGDVYFCANDGIYMEKTPSNTLMKLADINDAYGMAFDLQDNLIYSDKDCIYWLTPSQNSETCYIALKTSHEKAT